MGKIGVVYPTKRMEQAYPSFRIAVDKVSPTIQEIIELLKQYPEHHIVGINTFDHQLWVQNPDDEDDLVLIQLMEFN